MDSSSIQRPLALHIEALHCTLELAGRSLASGLENLRDNASKALVQARAGLVQQRPPKRIGVRHSHQHQQIVVPPRFAAILPGDGVAEQVIAASTLNFLNLYSAAITVRLIITWFPQAPEAIVAPLATICDPFLNIFRGIIPPIGGIDLSPIIAFTALNFATQTAAALPCEMPSSHASSSAPEEGRSKKKGFRGQQQQQAFPQQAGNANLREEGGWMHHLVQAQKAASTSK